MAITQIPFQDPVAPPEKPQPEQLGLYDQQDWEQAYRDLDARVPHLLIQLQDDLARSRRREAAWISIIAHLLLFICLWNLPLIEKTLGFHHIFIVPVSPTQDKNVTFLPLPPDVQKPPRRPNTNVMSDKDRIATARRPQLDPKELKKILATPPPGIPGAPGPRAPQVAPQQALPPSQAPAQQAQQSAPRPQFETNQTAQLQVPARPNNSFSKYAQGISAGSAIQQAAKAAADNRAAGGGGDNGYYGLGTGARGRPFGSFEILNDTLGVDFTPYMQRLKIIIYQHWYEVLPESVFPPTYKQGKLRIKFTILADGRLDVKEMALLNPSGDVALDRAAWGGITNSNPFPPLPPEFIQNGGKQLDLSGVFIYNIDVRELE